VLIPVVGSKPVPILFIEEYWVGQGLKWSIARIDFYGAFFQFYDDIPVRYINMYKMLTEQQKIKDNWDIRCTRKDVFVDCEYEFPQKWHSWIKPSANSQRQVAMYKDKWLFNSYWYLAEKNSWYWVRIYNKLLEVKKDGKEFWYWWKDKLPKLWTRIEFEFYPPYSSDYSDDELIDIVQRRILWKPVSLGMRSRPTFTFDIETAYTYFERYAKNHWLTTEELIQAILDHHLFLEEKREIYWLVE
jgi:hypothetical protein